ncbi:MAG: hypothetical protein KG012_04930 [Deltaproteobacteria bacterium]|nr:hypothetical protein [Deltaproteobacteria bacterium]
MPKSGLIIIIFILFSSTFSFAREIPFTQEDRDRLIRLEVTLKEFKESVDRRFEGVDKRFEGVDKRFEAIEKRFDQMINLFIGIVASFTAIVAATIGFAIWDRRTMIRPFEFKVKAIEDEIADNRSKLHSLIEAFRSLSKTDSNVAEILKKFNLL